MTAFTTTKWQYNFEWNFSLISTHSFCTISNSIRRYIKHNIEFLFVGVSQGLSAREKRETLLKLGSRNDRNAKSYKNWPIIIIKYFGARLCFCIVQIKLILMATSLMATTERKTKRMSERERRVGKVVIRLRYWLWSGRGLSLSLTLSCLLSYPLYPLWLILAQKENHIYEVNMVFISIVVV